MFFETTVIDNIGGIHNIYRKPNLLMELISSSIEIHLEMDFQIGCIDTNSHNIYYLYFPYITCQASNMSIDPWIMVSSNTKLCNCLIAKWSHISDPMFGMVTRILFSLNIYRCVVKVLSYPNSYPKSHFILFAISSISFYVISFFSYNIKIINIYWLSKFMKCKMYQNWCVTN